MFSIDRDDFDAAVFTQDSDAVFDGLPSLLDLPGFDYLTSSGWGEIIAEYDGLPRSVYSGGLHK